MSESMRESLSALMDDEANELEVERVLARIASDSDLRQVWVRYNAVHSLAAGQPAVNLEMDISSQVREAVAGDSRASSGFRQRLMRPLASMAVAASVAATVVLGGQQLAQLEADSYDAQAIASSVSPVGMVNSLGASSVQASYGTLGLPELQPATRTAYQKLARQRLHKYMQEHAEHAALNTPNGLVPFARVPRIQE